MMLLSIVLSCSRKTTTENQGISDSVNYQTLVIRVGGMTCGGCEMTIENAVAGIPGVGDIDANHLDSTATVIFDPSVTSIKQISDTINMTGYVVLGKKSGD